MKRTLIKEVSISMLATLIAILAILGFAIQTPTVAFADDTSTPPVTITYTDGTTDYWDGTNSIRISKACTITFNADVTTSSDTNGQLRTFDNNGSTDYEVIINGNGHTITSNVSQESGTSLCAINLRAKHTTINNLNVVTTSSQSNGIVVVDGDLEVNNCNFTSVAKGVFLPYSSSHITINGGTYKTTDAGNTGMLFDNSELSNAKITINGGTFTAVQQIANAGSYDLDIQDGTFYLTKPTNGVAMLSGGNINVTGGKFWSTGGVGIFAAGDSVKTSNCSIKNFYTSFFLDSANDSVTVGKDVTFYNRTDAYVYKGSAITLNNDMTNSIAIYVPDSSSISSGEKRQITTSADNSSLKSKIQTSNRGFSVGYDTDGQYFYIIKFDDSSSITYSTDSANSEIIATDGSNNTLTLSIGCKNTEYTGKPYDGLQITNNISEVLDVEPTYSYEGEDGTTYGPSATAPTRPGKYKVTVSLGGQSISTTFTIADAKQYKVSYEFKSDDSSKTLPAEVTKLLPTSTEAEELTSVTPTAPTSTSVKVSDGTWSFEGYSPEKVDSLEANTTFTGTWKFTEDKKDDTTNPDNNGDGTDNKGDGDNNGSDNNGDGTDNKGDGGDNSDNNDGSAGNNGSDNGNSSDNKGDKVLTPSDLLNTGDAGTLAMITLVFAVIAAAVAFSTQKYRVAKAIHQAKHRR